MTKKLRFGKWIPFGVKYLIESLPSEIPISWDMKFNEENERRSFGARLCLSKIANRLDPQNYSAGLTNRSQIEIKNHTTLTKLDMPHAVSLAHTDDFAMAAIGVGLTSIGVDIEFAMRITRIGIEKFFMNPQDTSELDPLEFWCLKEAAFKALSPYPKMWKTTKKKILTLKDISIKDDGAYYQNEQFAEFGLYEAPITRGEDLVFAFAWF